MKKSLFLGALAAVLCGCATLDNHVNMDWIPIGPDFPANKNPKGGSGFQPGPNHPSVRQFGLIAH